MIMSCSRTRQVLVKILIPRENANVLNVFPLLYRLKRCQNQVCPGQDVLTPSEPV